MGSLSLRVRYRPVRIGWCVESHEPDQLYSALRLTHAFAGGRFNPLIPVDLPELAERLVDGFRVDLLFPVAATVPIQAFVDAHDYLHWPEFEKKLFYEQWQDRPPSSCFLDVYHAARRLREEKVPKRRMLLLSCEPDDPLAGPVLAMGGAYPMPSASVPNYEELMEKLLGIERLLIGRHEEVPELLTRVTPSWLTGFDLEADEVTPDHGVYVGNARSSQDLLTFWNLQAAGSSLVFFDPSEAARLKSVVEGHKRWLASLPVRPWQKGGAPVTVYGRGLDGSEDFAAVGENVLVRSIGAVSWNGLNIRPALTHWKDQSVLGLLDESDRGQSLSFSLPEKPAYDVPELSHQHIAVSVRGSDPWKRAHDATFFPPYVPELNEYYGRQLYFDYARVRAEPASIWRSVALILRTSALDVTLYALPSLELVTKLFEAFGVAAKPSRAGLVTSRLISQMGGVQGCRVFKIQGVRTLIRKYSPQQVFTRSNAKQTIGNFDPLTGRPRFEPFERLFIAPRPGRRKLTPEDAFDFLLQRGVFRVGLELKCAHCELPSWLALDDVKTKVECPYCGTRFDVTEQLRDRDWAYRRSGLFGHDDHQHGGIPVAVTLQQLDTALSSDKLLYTTSLELAPLTTSITACETDFAVVTTGHSPERRHKPQLVIGECKADGGRITPEDAEHLAQVADALPHRRLSVFVLFAKTGAFTDEELSACARAQHEWYSRVILLSKEELEPYDIYERQPNEPHLHSTGLEDLANTPSYLYPALRPKGVTRLMKADFDRRVARRAFALYEARGREDGHDWEDWFTAELQLRDD